MGSPTRRSPCTTRGGLHRDIKPSNILVTGDDRRVLVDFGLSAAHPERRAAHDLAGTMDDMAPELLYGGAPSAATDLWSLGAALFVAWTGEHPHAGGPQRRWLARQLEPARALRALRPELPEEMGAPIAGMLTLQAEPRWTIDDLLRWCEPAVEPVSAARAWSGRQAESAWLTEQITRAVGVTILEVRGPAGIGKTSWLRRALREHRAIWSTSHALEGLAGQ